ncbi:MAG: pilus assembly protein HicB [Bacteroidaceae bacterium]
MKVTAIIEKGADGKYAIISNEEIGDFCLGGFGDSVEEAKADLQSVIKEAQNEYVKEHGELSQSYKTITISYKYDLAAFFNFFDWINISKFAKAAGINESKMRQYKVGSAFAGERTKDKIQAAIKRMSAELASASL